jgi:CRISPR-associated exonuclease Cas4
LKECNEYLMISGIQHFIYCRRQWALIHIEDQWTENGLTAEGRVMHKRVHDSSVRDNRSGVITVRGLRVRSDNLGITGECDAVELHPDSDGVELSGYKGKWNVIPVEYKHGDSKISDCDRMQVAAQVICLEEMLCCTIPSGVLFYEKTRRREIVEIDEELRETTIKTIEEMQKYFQRGYTPSVKTGKKCRQCSLRNICLPDMLRKAEKHGVERYIREHLEE